MKSWHFTDFDDFSSSVGGIDSVMLLQNAVRHRWDLEAVEISGTQVQVGRLGSGNIVEGLSSPDAYALYLPLTYTCAQSANGVLIPKGGFMILEPGCEMHLSIGSAHRWCSIHIPTLAFDHAGDLGEPSLASEKPTCRVIRPKRQLERQFRASVLELMTTAANYPQFESSNASAVASARLLKLGSEILGRSPEREPHRAGRPKIAREQIIRRSLELLEERSGERVVVADMAAAADVSERTLRAAFHEYYGAGPVHYLKLRRLNQVRRALRAAEPEEVTVTQVLLHHGVLQFGRFASQYRRLFGESPSETLQAGPPIVQVPSALQPARRP
jgi:AraC family ethanolamine operon transcriptional activator